MIKNPGNDSASISFKDTANSLGDSHSQANEMIQRAVQAHIDKLNAVVQQYQATEHGNAANIRNQGL